MEAGGFLISPELMICKIYEFLRKIFLKISTGKSHQMV